MLFHRSTVLHLLDSEHPLSVLGDMIVHIAGAVICLYVEEGELPGHLDQGDLIHERSVGIRVGVALPDGGSYPWEPFNHGLHDVEPLGEHLLRVWAPLVFSRVSAFPCDVVGGRVVHVPESTLLVTRRIEGLVLVSEGWLLDLRILFRNIDTLVEPSTDYSIRISIDTFDQALMHKLIVLTKLPRSALAYSSNLSSIRMNSGYMPSSTRSNKKNQLLFSPDPASLERSIRKEASSLSTDNNTAVSLNSGQPPSTQTPVPSTNSRSHLYTDNTNLPSTDTIHPTSIDIPSQTSIDTEP
ncbi:hypothetical protein F2Q69_00042120 [Brassica cretica]|uniref:Uncharacterized protein n=1 Tax=Brassica cretica TaxID=69181 RepID=A0A8S9NGK8_BRACR|nr:hypothetical protein F2Q69_00042120 [Brassica cretica]